MKKIISTFGAVLLACALTLVPAFATAVPSEDSDVTALVDSMHTYINDYLPGMSDQSQKAIEDYVRDGLTNSKDKFFMPMMSTLTNIREASDVGKAEGVTDVINDFNKLSKKAQDEVILNLTEAFEGIFLEVDFTGGVLKLSSAGTTITEIKFNIQPVAQTSESTKAAVASSSTSEPSVAESSSTSSAVATTSTSSVSSSVSASSSSESLSSNHMNPDAVAEGAPSPDITTMYFHAYIPTFPENEIEEVKKLITIYSDAGGGPEGSGALWRCIREIGTLMGREVDMEPDYSEFTVIKEGETDFTKLTPEVQNQIVEKAKEGMSGIAVTTTYENNVFKFSKKGEVQFKHTANGAIATSTIIIAIVIGIVIVGACVTVFLLRGKIFKPKNKE